MKQYFKLIYMQRFRVKIINKYTFEKCTFKIYYGTANKI